MAFNPLNYPLTFALPNFFSNSSAWVQHIPFAFTITAMLRPRTFVELGTHAGDSYLAFCQAIKTLGLKTQAAAVDTWKGDKHTGPYDSQFLSRLHNAHDPHYAGFSRLIQNTFDQALSSFADGSIDLLHIDGLHTYDAVRHDYETWFPKLSAGAVVLFHDTAITSGDFGVHRLFAELAAKHPSFNFHHGFGLGVLAPGSNTPQVVLEFLRDANDHADSVRACYAALGYGIVIRNTMQLVLDRAVATQSAVNQARRRENLLVDAKGETVEAALVNPVHYFDYQRATIEDLLARINKPTYTIGR